MLLRPPPSTDTLPMVENGWVRSEGRRMPFLTYAMPDVVHWSDELDGLHEEASRTHVIDIWARESILERIGRVRRPPS
jgi:hypothetical protein